MLSRTPPTWSLVKAKECYTTIADPASKHVADMLPETSRLLQAVRKLEVLMPETFEMAMVGDVCGMLRFPGLVVTISRRSGTP